MIMFKSFWYTMTIAAVSTFILFYESETDSAEKYRVRASSEHPGEGYAAHAVDGDPATYWHTRYGEGSKPHPHYIEIDQQAEKIIYGIIYLPRQTGSRNGWIDRYEIHVSGSSGLSAAAAASGRFAESPDPQKVIFKKPISGQYVRLTALSEMSGGPWASAAEIDVITDPSELRTIAEVKPSRARSVHLRYEAPDSAVFYNEMIIDESVPGSFFVACGFSQGYFGMQEDRSGSRQYILFSIWDPGDQDDPDSVAEEQRVRVLYRDAGAEITRFGNEGTGGQCYYKYSWKKGTAYRFAVKAEPAGEKTAYTAWFYINEKRSWKKIVTFETSAGGEQLRGYYSFIEDFRRDFKSYEQRRSARWRNGWVKTDAGMMTRITSAGFTADDLKVDNIDAGRKGNDYYLATGGSTRQNLAPGSAIQLPQGMAGPKPVLP